MCVMAVLAVKSLNLERRAIKLLGGPGGCDGPLASAVKCQCVKTISGFVARK